MLLAMCMAEPYGKDAIDAYTENPESMAFNCYFLGGVEKFVIDGHTITGLDKDGKEVFSHKYKLLDVENENGFIFYQSEDKDSGQFTYFAFSPDTMDHLEFRYAEDINDLQSWFEGSYAYWNAAGIAEDYDEATASLDVENETLIQTALSRLIKNKTVLIIAHRMRTVAGADKIVVLSDGVVAEQGSPSELYAQNGIYTHMADLQTQGQNWTI